MSTTKLQLLSETERTNVVTQIDQYKKQFIEQGLDDHISQFIGVEHAIRLAQIQLVLGIPLERVLKVLLETGFLAGYLAGEQIGRRMLMEGMIKEGGQDNH